MDSLEIIKDIRKQTALCRGLIYHLWQVPKISWKQKEAVRAVEIEFNKLHAYHYSRLRSAFGDENPYRADKCDVIAAKEWSDKPAEIIEMIRTAAADLQRMFLRLPGDDNNIDLQKDTILDEIQKYLSSWRNFELGRMKKAFE